LEPVINDDAFSDIARETVREIFPGKLVTGIKWFAGESFSKYAAVAPTVFALTGTNNAALGSGAEHHNDKFDVDDDTLQYALGAMVGFTVKLLNNKNSH
jgi:metal-dependent amidase/aminoacylase/carboxypeptidase family protein